MVLVVFDRAQIAIDALLRVFFENHDPTQGMRQGNDRGTQYRSVIYVDSSDDLAVAERARDVYAESLRAAGFSATKAQTLITVSAKVLSGELPLDAWQENMPIDTLRERLLDIRGIGPWTVNYTLLRGFGWLDGSLHGDVAVRHGMQILLDSPDKISEKAAQQWLAEFSPWRALLAAHLWAMKSLAA